jgi:hypothetical protein
MQTLRNTHSSAFSMTKAGVLLLCVWSIAGVASTALASENQAGKESTHVAIASSEKTISNKQAHGNAESEIDLSQLTMTVYKSPTCGCCSGWVEYMQEEGFKVNSIDTNDMDSVKTRLGLTDPRLHSCHTAVIDGYIVEGHVPADDVKRLLSEKPAILGLTAPGMPMMSPGMASRTPQGYDVLSVDEAGIPYLWSAY